MSVNTPHPDFAAHRASWRKQRVFREGGDAVKAAGEEFLPRLGDDTDQEYKLYKDRALFYGATPRTVQALVGTIFRKDPVIEFPAEEQLKRCGKAGESCAELIKRTTAEQLLPSRVGVLVDAPATPNAQPYAAIYFAENIINWQELEIDGVQEPIEVVLQEDVDVRDPNDRFTVRRRQQYRVLRLGKPEAPDEEQTNRLNLLPSEMEKPIYFQELWQEMEQVEGQEERDEQGNVVAVYTMTDIIVPRAWGGRVLNRIPFVLMNSDSLTFKPSTGPCTELVNANLSHYISSADLEHGRHFTALPTPVLAGFNPEFRLKIGSGVAWISENPSAHAYFLEFSGSGLGHLVEGQKHKEHLMATLGARLLEEPKAGVEAADAMRIRLAGEQSALTTVVVTGSQGWTKVLGYLAEWRGLPKEGVSCQINQEFDVAALDAGALATFMTEVQGGLLSYETFFYNQKKVGVYPKDWTIEQEKAGIEEGPPVAPPTPEEELARQQQELLLRQAEQPEEESNVEEEEEVPVA